MGKDKLIIFYEFLGFYQEKDELFAVFYLYILSFA